MAAGSITFTIEEGKPWRPVATDRAASLLDPVGACSTDNTLQQVFELHGATVLRVAQRILLNEADAEDAAQNVFLKLSRALSTFQSDREFFPWLYRVTVNAANDIRRSRRPTHPLEEELASPEILPDQQAAANQRSALLYKALRRLSDRERECIVLRDLEGLTTTEVAVALGTAEVTVRSYISTGRVKLRTCLENLGTRR